jgi:hypothetical protein
MADRDDRRERPDRATGSAPKEQPPRKLSGKRTGRSATLWKAAGGFFAVGSPKE